MKTTELVRSAVIAAIIFVCLLLLNIQTATDIISLAYVVVFSTAIMFGGKIAGAGCGIGAMLFDITGGYVNYAPFTLLAYGLMAFFIGKFLVNDFKINKAIVVGLMATFINILVYFIANFLYYGLPFAISSIPIEFINCAIGMIIGIPLGKFLKKIIPSSLR